MKKRTLLRSFAAMPLAFPLMSSARETPAPGDHFTAASRIADVEADPAFKGFGRLLFPLESRYWSGTTLGDISLDWYSEIRVANTVAVFNFLKREAEAASRSLRRFMRPMKCVPIRRRRMPGLSSSREGPGRFLRSSIARIRTRPARTSLAPLL